VAEKLFLPSRSSQAAKQLPVDYCRGSEKRNSTPSLSTVSVFPLNPNQHHPAGIFSSRRRWQRTSEKDCASGVCGKRGFFYRETFRLNYNLSLLLVRKAPLRSLESLLHHNFSLLCHPPPLFELFLSARCIIILVQQSIILNGS
jgi:hypothetical protein